MSQGMDRERQTAVVPVATARDARRVERGFWRKLRRTLGRIPFTADLLAAYYCATDRATPAHVKAVLVAALAYFVVPTDMIPDFIAAFGYADDASVLAGAIATVRRHISPAHRNRAAAYLERAAAGGVTEPPDEIS